MEISATVKTVLIVAAAIVIAYIALKVLAIVVGIVSFIITLAIAAAVLYILFLVIKSTIFKRSAPQQASWRK